MWYSYTCSNTQPAKTISESPDPGGPWGEMAPHDSDMTHIGVKEPDRQTYSI